MFECSIVEGDTGEYERIETALKKAGYGPTDESFRWKQTGRQGLQVEFFCPAGEGRPAARMFRPRADESPTAKLNFGPKLSAFAIDAGEVIGLDVVIVEREVTLPEDGGRTNFSFRVTGLVAFLLPRRQRSLVVTSRRMPTTSCGSSRTGMVVPSAPRARSGRALCSDAKMFGQR